MAPKEAADTLILAMPVGFSGARREQYGIEPIPERARKLFREPLSLNLPRVCAAIEAQRF